VHLLAGQLEEDIVYFTAPNCTGQTYTFSGIEDRKARLVADYIFASNDPGLQSCVFAVYYSQVPSALPAVEAD